MTAATTTLEYRVPATRQCTALLTEPRIQQSEERFEGCDFHLEWSRDSRSPLIGSHSRKLDFQRALDEISEARELPMNWDSEGGAPAAEVPSRFAEQLVRSLQSSYQIPPPRVCPLSGGVYLEWRCNGTELYFEAEEDSVLSAMRRHGHLLQRDEDHTFDVQRARWVVERMYDGE